MHRRSGAGRRTHQHLRKRRRRRGFDGQGELADARQLRRVGGCSQRDDVGGIEPGQDPAVCEAINHDHHGSLGRRPQLPQHRRQGLAHHGCVDDHGVDRRQGLDIGNRRLCLGWQGRQGRQGWQGRKAALQPHVRTQLPGRLQHGGQCGTEHQHPATSLAGLGQPHRCVAEPGLDLQIGQRGHGADRMPGVDRCLDQQQAFDISTPVQAHVAGIAHRLHDRMA